MEPWLSVISGAVAGLITAVVWALILWAYTQAAGSDRTVDRRTIGTIARNVRTILAGPFAHQAILAVAGDPV
jgi:hypothetical protein